MKIGEKSCIALLAHHKTSKHKAFRAFTRDLCVIACLIPSLVCADKLILGGVSHHYMPALDNNCGYNEEHPALGLERKGWEFGVYKNSIEKPSAFIAKVSRPFEITDSFSIGYRVGIASGYKGKTECESKLEPYWETTKTVDENGRERIRATYNTPRPLEDNFNSYKGLLPQAHLLFTYETEKATFDLGVGVVSTLTFKLNL